MIDVDDLFLAELHVQEEETFRSPILNVNIQFGRFSSIKKKENAKGIRSSTTEVHDCFVRVSSCSNHSNRMRTDSKSSGESSETCVP